jgi:hypothetical protein
VPAAAVIPAPIAYIKIVDVKKLVVDYRPLPAGPLVMSVYWTWWWLYLLVNMHVIYLACVRTWNFTLNKSECSKQAVLPECYSME